MKKLLVLIMALCISAALFADVTGSVTNTTAYDPDAETLADTIATSVVIGPVTLANTFYLTQLLTAAEFAWGSAIDYAVNEAITVGVKSGYNIASDLATVTAGTIPLVLSGAWKVADFFSVSASYTNDNLTPLDGEEGEIGSFSVVLTATF